MSLYPCHYASFTSLRYLVHTVNISTETEWNSPLRDPVVMTLSLSLNQALLSSNQAHL